MAHGEGQLLHLLIGTVAQTHEMGDGQTDDIVQEDHDRQRDQAPQTSAHGVDPLVCIELLQLLLVLHLVVGVLLLQLLLLVRQTAHTDHTLLALHLEGQHHQLHHQGEEDQGHAVGPGEAVEQAHQPSERRGNQSYHQLSSSIYGR